MKNRSINSFGYLLKEGFRNLLKNKLMTIASIGVLTCCYIIFGVAIVISQNVNLLIGEIENENELFVFLKDEVSSDEITTFSNYIRDFENVAVLTYISKDDALELERERLGDEAYLLDRFEDDNPYPNSFSITLTDVSLMAEFVTEIEGRAEIEEISAPIDFAESILSIRNTVTYAGIGIGVAMVLIALIIVTNTIRLTMYARRKEINIMKYVGATNSFIRLPFIIEGMFLGLLAAAIALGVVSGVYVGLIEYINTSGMSLFGMVDLKLVELSQMLPVLTIGFLGSGAIIGSAISLFSISRHLKV